MLVVSGCPRSGTSLMMDIMRSMLGPDRIIGEQYPMQQIVKLFDDDDDDDNDNMSPEMREALRYSYSKQNPDWRKKLKEYMDMNPQGYWECKYTTKGIRYSIDDLEQLERIKVEPKDKLSVCKLVSQGLYHSDPVYIDKVIFMVRNPREVAKSQERLKRTLMVLDRDQKAVNALEDVKVHSPAMFINVSLWAAKWFNANPDVSVHIVQFNDLIGNPEEELIKLVDFLGEGVVRDGLSRVRRELKRSSPEDVESDLWGDAEFVYECLKEKNWKKIITYFEESRATTEERKRWYCVRRGAMASRVECERCLSNPIVRNNFRKTATERNINWIKEPCMFEVAFDQRVKRHLTIQESIEENFWLHNIPVEENDRILP